MFSFVNRISANKRKTKGKITDAMLQTRKGLSMILNNISSLECEDLQHFSVVLY